MKLRERCLDTTAGRRRDRDRCGQRRNRHHHCRHRRRRRTCTERRWRQRRRRRTRAWTGKSSRSSFPSRWTRNATADGGRTVAVAMHPSVRHAWPGPFQCTIQCSRAPSTHDARRGLLISPLFLDVSRANAADFDPSPMRFPSVQQRESRPEKIQKRRLLLTREKRCTKSSTSNVSTNSHYIGLRWHRKPLTVKGERRIFTYFILVRNTDT